jgi:hypothetical protein
MYGVQKQLAGSHLESTVKTAGFGVPSFVPSWCAAVDETGQYCLALPL